MSMFVINTIYFKTIYTIICVGIYKINNTCWRIIKLSYLLQGVSEKIIVKIMKNSSNSSQKSY